MGRASPGCLAPSRGPARRGQCPSRRPDGAQMLGLARMESKGEAPGALALSSLENPAWSRDPHDGSPKIHSSLKSARAPAGSAWGPHFPSAHPAVPATLPFGASGQQLSGLEQVASPLGPQFPLCDLVLMVLTSGGPRRPGGLNRSQPEITQRWPTPSFRPRQWAPGPASGSALGGFQAQSPRPGLFSKSPDLAREIPGPRSLLAKGGWAFPRRYIAGRLPSQALLPLATEAPEQGGNVRAIRHRETRRGCVWFGSAERGFSRDPQIATENTKGPRDWGR